MKRGSVNLAIVLFIPLFLTAVFVLANFLVSHRRLIEESKELQNELHQAHQNQSKRFDREIYLIERDPYLKKKGSQKKRLHRIYGEFD